MHSCLITKNPGNHEVRYNLAVTYAKKGLYHDAVAACEKLLESDPGNA
ncbi:MAG: tetratricopeptide repeat protein, partial [Melioribacteraceae bacterium]